MDVTDGAARPCRVAVVDDDPGTRPFIARAVERELPGVEVLEGGTGFDAIALRFLEPPPALMIINHEMPGLNGMDAVREIRLREREEGTHVPIVFETGYGRGHFPQESLDSVDAWLAKPFSIAAVQEAIRPFLPQPDRSG